MRINDQIGGDRADYRVYSGVIERDIRGENGHLAIPRGSTAELIVRTQRDGDLIVDLESVTVNGQRYAVDTATLEVDTDHGLIGGGPSSRLQDIMIFGAYTGCFRTMAVVTAVIIPGIFLFRVLRRNPAIPTAV